MRLVEAGLSDNVVKILHLTYQIATVNVGKIDPRASLICNCGHNRYCLRRWDCSFSLPIVINTTLCLVLNRCGEKCGPKEDFPFPPFRHFC